MMRITIKEQKDTIKTVICNGCGKRLATGRTGMMMEDYVHVEKTWGFFSGQDGQKITFDLCEDCIHQLTKHFEIPAYEEDVTELL